jgi:ATP-binding cassette subfamily F protein 3
MSLIQIEQLTKSFGAQALFAPFSAHVTRGDRIALVGDNGVGKSTLLSMIAGAQEPSGGEIHRAQGMCIGHLPQLARLEGEGTLYQAIQRPFAELLEAEKELRRLEELMAERSDPEILHHYDELLHAFERRGGYTIDSTIRSVLIGVGFTTEEFLRPVSILSGGEEARAALARTLLEGTDLLLLDEPTNHLDFTALAWLEERLLEFPGAIILVSHDRHLLDRVANLTWEIAFGEFTAYRGGYSRSRALREAAHTRRLELYERQQATIERHKEFIRRHHAGQKHRQAKDREKKLGRIEKESVKRPQKAKRIGLRIPIGAPSGKRVLKMEGLQIGYTFSLFTCPNLVLYRGERVAIIGENGCGKTTFLKTIIGKVAPLSGRIVCGHGVRIATYSQTQEGLHKEGTVLDAILSRCDLSIGQARGHLARFLFSGDDVTKKLKALSGGEKSRVALALLSLMEGNLLLLDEPTNHLDLKSQEILEETLLNYTGTILLVSHDRALLEAVATRVWEIHEGQLRAFSCAFRAYEKRLAAERASTQSVVQQVNKVRVRKRPPTRKKPDKYKEKKRTEALKALEGEIEQLEAKLRRLEKELLDASTRGERVKIMQVGKEHKQLTQALKERFAEWERLSAEGMGTTSIL